jgi:zinc/manganese transport system ATP-binding protein
MIELQNLTVRRGTQTVLNDISLSIADGEFIGVLGPNGAGKTTLFRTILGLQAAAGQIRVLGGPVRRGNPDIGYMPQTRSAPGGAICGFDVLVNAASGQKYGLPLGGRALRAEVMAALEAVNGVELAARPIANLSGGQRQRLLLAAALLGRPQLLLLDEPLISLDPAAQGVMIELIAKLQKEQKFTVLFAAHDVNPLLGVMDRVLYLSGGNAAIGTVNSVITSHTLSKLYGAEIEVVRAAGRIFVLSGQHDDHHACGHAHA